MTKYQSDDELRGYFQEARSWADDRQLRSSRLQRVAWIVAGVATTIAALEAIALAGLAPLKTIIPMTVLVDRQTGHVTTLDPSQPVRLMPDAALAKSMLAQYVIARESVDRSTIAGDYRKVVLWSGEAARSSYLNAIKPGSPDNPLARLPLQQTIQARVKSVSLLDNGQALVRFALVQRNELGNESRPAPYASVIRYRFRDRALAEADRFINPLGFEVVRYRKDAEVESAAPEAAAVGQLDQPESRSASPTSGNSLAGRG